VVAVLKGVTIGDGAVIGANAVVTRDVPDYSIAVGVPSRVLRKRVPGSYPT
jgi:virginiamycin A acetyltransferase